MSELVDPAEIEKIVGTTRHETIHYGRAISEEEQVFILHSQECLVATPDLRDCEYSIALDRGITLFYPWLFWVTAQDRPVALKLERGYLLPDPSRTIDEAGGQ